MLREAQYATRPGSGTYVALTSDGNNTLVHGGKCRVWAISLCVTTNAVGTVLIRDGLTVSGTGRWRLDAPATDGTTTTVEFPQGLVFNTGLFIDWVAGNIIVSVCYSVDNKGAA